MMGRGIRDKCNGADDEEGKRAFGDIFKALRSSKVEAKETKQNRVRTKTKAQSPTRDMVASFSN